MDTQDVHTGRHEEFGHAPWTGAILALLLIVTLRFSFLQPHSAAVHTPAAIAPPSTHLSR